MTFIKRVVQFASGRQAAKRALLLCGFGGSVWQVRRLVRTLNRAGYDVTVFDFSLEVLRSGDPALLPQLVDETVAFAEGQAARSNEPPLLIGVSLGALMALNIIRRSKTYTSGVLITGGDIVKIARKLYPRKWRLAYDEHAERWRDINMYTAPSLLKGKRLLFVLPKRDRLVDRNDLRKEIATQRKAGNSLTIVERRGGHFATIIAETVLFPRRVLTYIAHL